MNAQLAMWTNKALRAHPMKEPETTRRGPGDTGSGPAEGHNTPVPS